MSNVPGSRSRDLLIPTHPEVFDSAEPARDGLTSATSANTKGGVRGGSDGTLGTVDSDGWFLARIGFGGDHQPLWIGIAAKVSLQVLGTQVAFMAEGLKMPGRIADDQAQMPGHFQGNRQFAPGFLVGVHI